MITAMGAQSVPLSDFLGIADSFVSKVSAHIAETELCMSQRLSKSMCMKNKQIKIKAFNRYSRLTAESASPALAPEIRLEL